MKTTLHKFFSKSFMTALTLTVVLSFTFLTVSADVERYADSWGPQGLSLKRQSSEGVGLNFSIQEFNFVDRDINGIIMKGIEFSESLLQNEEGSPDLPGFGRFIAIPQGATAIVEIVNMRTERFVNVDIAPAPRIPLDTEDGPLHYEKDQSIYTRNELYPAQPVTLGDFSQIRGVDVAMLGITPYQYNPATKELIVYRDIEINIRFEGGNRQFGDEKYRNAYYDVILEDAIFNYSSLPVIDYSARVANNTRSTGWEYVIITPNNPEFVQWADSIKKFRTEEGILTGVVKLSDIGEFVNANMLKTYVTNAYNNWDIPPVAVLMLGDFGSDNNTRITSPIWNNYCASDNILGDISGNHMPDIIFARITAQDAPQLESMIKRFMDYERNPPTNPSFYDKPITALGWQTTRWFQICSEVVGGFWKNSLGKNPVRINEIYEGYPGSTWSTNQNTSTVVGVFGPDGLGYIPAAPSELGNWSGGNASQINSAINAGSFMLMHRDHGGETGWGEPYYSNTNINGLNNTDLCFVLSINCLTGKYNYNSECFTEKFHRHTSMGAPSGALGLIAASEVSYSFVNDVYVWGLMDNMWPNFMPQYGSTPAERGILPAFGNAAGKYFLQQSNWPYNTNNKVVTYNLFHHHGDAFMRVCASVPSDIVANYEPEINENETVFSISATSNSRIALTVDGVIIGKGFTGLTPQIDINIPTQLAGTRIKVVATLQNARRYEGWIDVVAGVTTAWAGEDIMVCEGTDYQLTATATNYESLLWETSGNGTFSDVSILDPIYSPSEDDFTSGAVILSFTAFNTAVNDSTDYLTLSFNPAPVVSAGSAADICATDTYTATDAYAENHTSITWTTSGQGTFDDVTAMNPVYTPSAEDKEAGNVVLTMSATNEYCEAVESQIELNIHALPEPVVTGPESVCQFQAETVYTAGTETNEYQWEVTGGTIVDGQNTFSPTITWDEAGTGVITLTETNEFGCLESTTYEVMVNALPTPAIDGNERVCANSEQIIYASPLVEGNLYEWMAEGGEIFAGATANEVGVNWGGNGNGLLTLIETSSTTGCSAQTDYNVLISSPIISLGADTSICLTHMLTLTGEDGYASYLWSNGETSQSIQLVGEELGEGSMPYSLTVTDEYGCEGVSTITVMVGACLGIESPRATNKLTIIPNPNNGEFTLEINQAASGKTGISVINTQGEVVFKKSIFVSQSMHKENLHLNLSSGIYFIRIESTQGTSIQKLVIK